MNKVGKRLTMLFVALVTVATMSSCDGSLITNSQTRAKIEQRLAERADWIPEMPSEYVGEQREALKFLYAYMLLVMWPTMICSYMLIMLQQH